MHSCLYLNINLVEAISEGEGGGVASEGIAVTKRGVNFAIAINLLECIYNKLY